MSGVRKPNPFIVKGNKSLPTKTVHLRFQPFPNVAPDTHYTGGIVRPAKGNHRHENWYN